MSDKTIAERLQPSLLDRLTDDAPSEKTESRDARVMDLRQLRDILQRDLAWLLNTSDSSAQIDADRYPHAFGSVVNFGIREVAGDYSTVERAELIRKSIVDAIQIFEPRIHPGSLDVQLRIGEQQRESIVSFDIRADMWAQPMPIELYLRSQVDVTTGELELERVA
ncbi:type VI secretion system baseplate subunit TssE [Tateyamaria sp. ANG-S1]|uniref:type VI secretion system baseplate subunit TssE n=1 Tax=Tateyamaria sp. ANG-S1 TaxID=1577905 RepID=UPI00057C6B85|nr:type VI secretion system baseplate subunit TssE [Tateyamaria sp. ANG-S1]KIC47727.1 type VI secretion protein [Tateyamaria sp. ANG-S1]